MAPIIGHELAITIINVVAIATIVTVQLGRRSVGRRDPAESAWNETFADVMRQLLVIDADKVRQKLLRKLGPIIDRLRLETELKALDSEVPDEALNA